MVEFSNHSFLILQVFLITIDQSISLINHRPDIVKGLRVQSSFETGQRIIQSLVLLILPLELVVHCLNCVVISFKLT